MCKSWCEAIIAVVVIVFALLINTWTSSQWVLVIAGIILLIHSFTCKKCFSGHGMAMKTTMPARRKRR